MTAAGLLCTSQLGGTRARLRSAKPSTSCRRPGRAKPPNAYYHHWAAELLRRHGGDDWEKWNTKLRDSLVARQKADGGWPVEREPFATGGRTADGHVAGSTDSGGLLPRRPAAGGQHHATRDGKPTWNVSGRTSPPTTRSKRGVPSGPWPAPPAGRCRCSRTRWRPRARPAADDRQVARLIADLDDDDFAVREKATAGLAKLGTAAEPALRQALKDRPPAESRRRLEALVSALEGATFTPEHRRLLRAVEVLEHIGTPEAQRVLRRLDKESQEVDLARAARAALGRLAVAPGQP